MSKKNGDTLSPNLARLKDETPMAYQAFLDYIALPPPRSIPALVAFYEANKTSRKQPAELTIKGWSAEHEWKRREGAFIDELAIEYQRQAKEFLARRTRKVTQQAEKLEKQIDEMIDEFSKSRIARRVTVPDPRDPAKTMDIVHMKVNTLDLRSLVQSFGRLNKDLKTILGEDRSTSVNIRTPGTAGKIKAYVTITDEEGNTFSGPDDWPEPGELDEEGDEGDEDREGDEDETE